MSDQIKNAIEEAPTEDVVPRAEVEKAKQEVARELIEEFEEILDIMYEAAKITGNIMSCWKIFFK